MVYVCVVLFGLLLLVVNHVLFVVRVCLLICFLALEVLCLFMCMCWLVFVNTCFVVCVCAFFKESCLHVYYLGRFRWMLQYCTFCSALVLFCVSEFA